LSYIEQGIVTKLTHSLKGFIPTNSLPGSCPNDEVVTLRLYLYLSCETALF
jgi:hypothetical protein